MRKIYYSLIALLGFSGTAMAVGSLDSQTRADSPDYTVVGTYDLTIQPTDMAGSTSGETEIIKVEVRQSADTYCMAEVGDTEYFNGYTIPFSYSDATKLALFESTYSGETTDPQFTESPYLWVSAFVFNGAFTEPQPQLAVKFDPSTGFSFSEDNDTGFAWFASDSKDDFMPWDVFSGFYVYGPSNEGDEGNGEDYGDASIEGIWEFTLNGHYIGDWSAGEFTSIFNATLEGNTVKFESTDSQYNIVAEFTAENTLTFKKALVGSAESLYGLWQSPYINNNGTEDLEDLKEEVFSATYNSFNGTLTFPAKSGLAYGIFNNEDGELSYWDDAFDFVSASLKKAEVPDYADASIVGDWEFTLDGHYLGAYSLGVFTEKFEASLEGNIVNFNSSGSQYNIVAEFVAANTLKFNFCPVGNPATFTLYQSPYINFDGVEDIEELTEMAFVATYSPSEGVIRFPEDSGLRYGYFDEAGELSYWDDAFDFISASRSQEEVTVGEYVWTIQPTDITGSNLGEMIEVKVEVKKSGDTYTINELEGTKYFNNQAIPFTYNEETEFAQFTAQYAGELDSQPVWLSAFVYNEGNDVTGPFIEVQENFGVTFNTETGFEFKEGSGFAWFVTTSAEEFDAQSVYSAFYVVPTGVSAINGIESSNEGETIFYDLQGRRVNNPKSGLYIMKSGSTVKKVMLPK